MRVEWAKSLKPFGGMSRRFIGLNVEYGSIGSTVYDPRSNMIFVIEIGWWWRSTEFRWNWKAKLDRDE